MEDKIEDLKNRMEERFKKTSFYDTEDEISLYSLQSIIDNSMRKYNTVLVDDTRKLCKEMNRQSMFGRVFKDTMPLIKYINPIILENGEYYLDFLFTDKNGKYKGEAHVDKDFNIKVYFLHRNHNDKKVKDFLKKYYVRYMQIFKKMQEFKEEYPEQKCSWNYHCNEVVYTHDDGFLRFQISIDEPTNSSVTLSNIDDIDTSLIRSKRYGVLDDYIDFYKKRLMKSTPVKIEDLDGLFYEIVKKNLDLTRGNELKLTK